MVRILGGVFQGSPAHSEHALGSPQRGGGGGERNSPVNPFTLCGPSGGREARTSPAGAEPSLPRGGQHCGRSPHPLGCISHGVKLVLFISRFLGDSKKICHTVSSPGMGNLPLRYSENTCPGFLP